MHNSIDLSEGKSVQPGPLSQVAFGNTEAEVDGISGLVLIFPSFVI